MPLLQALLRLARPCRLRSTAVTAAALWGTAFVIILATVVLVGTGGGGGLDGGSGGWTGYNPPHTPSTRPSSGNSPSAGPAATTIPIRNNSGGSKGIHAWTSWPQLLLAHARAHFASSTTAATTFGSGRSPFSDEAIRTAEQAERCAMTADLHKHNHDGHGADASGNGGDMTMPMHSTPEAVCGGRSSPDALSRAAADSRALCDSMRALVWSELVPRLSPSLQTALLAQRKLHEEAAAGRAPPSQKYLVWSLSGGLGNRFQSLASTFVAAMLSGRVFLMKDWFTALPPNTKGAKPTIFPSKRTADYVLEPLQKLFEATMSASGGSSSGPAEEPRRPPNSMLLCALMPMMSLREYRHLYPRAFAAPGDGGDDNGNRGASSERIVAPFREDHVKIDISARHDKRLVRWNRFACGSDFLHHRNDSSSLNNNNNNNSGALSMASSSLGFFSEKHVYVWTNQYYLPIFFANPTTGPTMRQWFPVLQKRNKRRREGGDDAPTDPMPASAPPPYDADGPYSVLTKLLVLPSSHVMRRVIRFLDEGSNSFEKSGDGDSRSDTSSNGNRVPLVPGRFTSLQVRAFQTSAFAAMAVSFDRCLKTPPAPPQQRPFFLATLHKPVREYFIKHYGSAAVRTLTPPTHEQGTGKHYSGDLDALSDMFVLSLSGRLLVSPGSTFGGFVAAFADISPERVDYFKPPLAREGGSTSSSSSQCVVVDAQQPCFGAWFRYDRIGHRSGSGTVGDSGLSCRLVPLPPNAHNCA